MYAVWYSNVLWVFSSLRYDFFISPPTARWVLSTFPPDLSLSLHWLFDQFLRSKIGRGGNFFVYDDRNNASLSNCKFVSFRSAPLCRLGLHAVPVLPYHVFRFPYRITLTWAFSLQDLCSSIGTAPECIWSVSLLVCVTDRQPFRLYSHSRKMTIRKFQFSNRKIARMNP